MSPGSPRTRPSQSWYTAIISQGSAASAYFRLHVMVPCVNNASHSLQNPLSCSRRPEVRRLTLTDLERPVTVRSGMLRSNLVCPSTSRRTFENVVEVDELEMVTSPPPVTKKICVPRPPDAIGQPRRRHVSGVERNAIKTKKKKTHLACLHLAP